MDAAAHARSRASAFRTYTASGLPRLPSSPSLEIKDEDEVAVFVDAVGRAAGRAAGRVHVVSRVVLWYQYGFPDDGSFTSTQSSEGEEEEDPPPDPPDPPNPLLRLLSSLLPLLLFCSPSPVVWTSRASVIQAPPPSLARTNSTPGILPP